MTSLFLGRLKPEQRSELIDKLWNAQGGNCFICEQPIDLEVHANSIDIDHVEPTNTGGKDVESNFAVTHAPCNRSKQAADLRVARVLARFSAIQEAAKRDSDRGANLSDILSAHNGARHHLGFKIDGNHVSFSFAETGDADIRSAELYTDRLSGVRYFFANLPIEYLHHDDKINPRNIGSNISKLVTEFFRGRPQLHVSLGWISSAGNGSPVKVFDGQHKATAQVLLGARSLPVRVFVDPDTELLLTTNTNAGTTLRQVAFDKSVQRRLGSALFRDRLARFREERGLPEDALHFSETDLVAHFKGESRELKRYIIDNQRDQITADSENRLAAFMDYAGKGSEKPLSYNTIEKTFYSFFIYPKLLETPLDHGDDTDSNPRGLETDQVVRLMNIVADEIYVDHFDPVLGTARLENKVQKGEHIPEGHLRAFRMGKEEIMYSWLRYVPNVVIANFVASGLAFDDQKLFQYKFSEVLWNQLEAYVRNLAAMTLWVNVALSTTIFGGKQSYDFWRTIWETGRSPQGTQVIPAPLNIMELTKLSAGTTG